jgi:hypothetical protein
MSLRFFERYGIEVTPVVFLLEVGRPAIAEEPFGIGICAMAHVFDMTDAGSG